MDPALEQAARSLTDEHQALGERGAKEMAHDRKRSQLDVYLVCSAFRANRATAAAAAGVSTVGGDDGNNGDPLASWQLCEEDKRILDGLIREAAAVGP